MKRQEAIKMLNRELDKAVKKHGSFPISTITASLVIVEETGKLAQAVLDANFFPDEPGNLSGRTSEYAARVAAMAIRFLMHHGITYESELMQEPTLEMHTIDETERR